MCKGISMIIVRGQITPFWLKNQNRHSEIRKHFNLPDDSQLINSLPVEMLPTGTLTNSEEWEFSLDTNINLPDWYSAKDAEYQAECWKVLRQEILEINQTGIYGGDLDLQDTQVKDLGVLQSVGGYLDLRGTQVKITDEIKHKFSIII